MTEPNRFGHRVESTISPGSLPFAFYALATAVLGFYVLWVTKGVLVPLVTAVFVSFLIMSLKRLIDRIPLIGRITPDPLAFLFSFLLIAGSFFVLALIVRENIGAVLEKAPEYQARFAELAQQMLNWAEGVPFIPEEFLAPLASIVEGIGSGMTESDQTDEMGATAADQLRQQAIGFVRNFVTGLTSALGGLVSGLITTFMYTAFILIERGRVVTKFKILANNDHGERFVENVLDDIARLVRTYISLKTTTSFIVAFISFIIMTLMGTDFAGFWALLIFAFGFVPIIGAIIAITLPTMLTLVAPDGGLLKAALTLGLLIGAEQSVSSFIEPRLLGKELNLSPLVILLSLATWGTLWGFSGMLLSIPITVTLLIVLAQFETTRPIAVMLSADGKIDSLRRDRLPAEGDSAISSSEPVEASPAP